MGAVEMAGVTRRGGMLRSWGGMTTLGGGAIGCGVDCTVMGMGGRAGTGRLADLDFGMSTRLLRVLHATGESFDLGTLSSSSESIMALKGTMEILGAGANGRSTLAMGS